jgi:hypothetical protein
MIFDERPEDISPAQNFFSVISQTFTLLDQRENQGAFTYLDEAYFCLEVVENFNGIGGEIWRHLVHLRSIWVPPSSRRAGWMASTLELLLSYADACGVAIDTVSNPFELSSMGKSIEDNRRIFLGDVGFRYLPNHQDKQHRQRKRLRKLGFRNVKMKSIGSRDRVRKKDCWIFIPSKFDKELLSLIYKTDW